MSSLARTAGPVHVGMDTSKNTIMVAVLWPDEEIPVTERILNDEPSVRRLLGRLADKADGPQYLRCCYEAGPGGYDLYRLLDSMGIACDVVAPSLIPKGSGDRVKTDKRDSRRLARLHRAGELTPVRVPSRDEEAVRDLARARTALLEDRKTAQKRLTAILMRHGRTWRGPAYWTRAHRDWIAAQKFAEPALATAVGCYRAALETRETELAAIEAELLPWVSREPLAEPAARLMCYRGIAELTALTLAAEVVDWRRFPAARVHGIHRAVPGRGLQRRHRPPRAHHQGRPATRAHRAGRVRPGLPAPPGNRGRAAPAAARRVPGHPGPLPEGPAPAARPVHSPGQPRQDPAGGRHRGGPRARRVHLGGDDLLTPRP